MTLRGFANRAIARIFAPPCAACGGIIPHPLDGAVCAACWDALTRFSDPLCAGVHHDLRSVSSPGSRVIACQAAVGPYEGTLRAVVHALKYDRRRSVAPPLSLLMRRAGAHVLRGADAVVPVPLHSRRQWTRGFNQAELLASGLAPPVRRLLTRVRATPPQVDLPAADRYSNVRDAFALNPRAVRGAPAVRQTSTRGSLDGLVLVVVDDVATTGATLEACARVLRDGGAEEVRALTAARVVSEPR